MRRRSGMAPSRRVLSLLLAVASALLLPAWLGAQGGPLLQIDLPDGSDSEIRIESHRGYWAFDAGALASLGWNLSTSPARDEAVLAHRSGLTLGFTLGSPYLRWDEDLIQAAHAPYWFGGSLYLPIQILVDLFPGLLPRAYRFDSERYALIVAGAGTDSGTEVAGRASQPPTPTDSAPSRTAPPETGPARVVVIDPGHGGDDPGAIGSGGTQEKDIALALGMALARELAGDPEIEVRLTRDRDLAVPLWSRGESATEWKGERPGVFISIHANALPDRTGVRGFESYFLSEARDEHERRVAALENAPLAASGPASGSDSQDPLLGEILRDLRTFDHQHWSADLANEVQRELGEFHPGPDRGVKQAPFAVITNSMMPSVLVEVGFITNAEEERLLSRADFHRQSAQALARAIRRFFERYPPGP